MRADILTFKRARKLRRAMTLSEVVLWERLRGGRLFGLRFRRRHPIGPYILDFFCAAERFAVEVDGATHDHPGQVAHDERRTTWLIDRGVRVFRAEARDVLRDEELEDVLAGIARAAAPSTALRAVPLPRHAGEEPEAERIVS